ncbi:MAG TPA: hypothetical protein P5058_05190 [Eubacteriales bacterium]|nr:hypothetical protein [Eubacteriales bacterium]
MEKIKKGSMLLAAFLVILTMASCAAGLASAQNEPLERVFNPKYDMVFEDFDRADLGTGVTVNENVADSGKAYLAVEYGEETTTPDDAIYKQALPGDTASRGNLVIVMKSSDLSGKLSELVLGTRRNDNYKVYTKTFDALADPVLDALPELTAEYQKYIINFANSYEDSEVYLNPDDTPSEVKVNSGLLLGIHLMSAADAEGKIEIDSIYFTTDNEDASPAERTMLNSFIGGDDVFATAKAANPDTWWCGSATGVVTKRTLTLSDGGEVTIVNEAKKSGDFDYVVIEADGDTENLTVSTTADGTTFGTPATYAKVMPLAGEISGVKLALNSGSVTLRRVFFTSLTQDVVGKLPNLDGTDIQLFDDFSVSQSGFTDNYDEMAAKPEAAQAGMQYRLSYRNGGKVRIENGMLVFDATDLGDDYINFKCETNTPNTSYAYIVMKVKGIDGATLDGFRMGTGVNLKYFNQNQLLSAAGLPIPALSAADYPFTNAAGFKYLIIDIAESGLDVPPTGVATMDFYYSGAGKLLIDEIFFANAYVGAEFEDETVTGEFPIELNAPAETGYNYLGFVYAPNVNSQRYMKLELSADGAISLETVRVEFVDVGTFYFGDNESRFRGIKGAALATDFTDTASIVIDLMASGLDNLAFESMHFHGGALSEIGGQITIESIKYYDEKPYAQTAVAFDETTFTPTAPGYQYFTFVPAANPAGYQYLLLDITGGGGASLDTLRFEFIGAGTPPAALGVKWFSENEAGTLKGRFGESLNAIGTTKKTFVIDLAASGIDAAAVTGFHIHTGGTDVGGTLTFGNIRFASFGPAPSDSLAQIAESIPDNGKPIIELALAETAKAGDTITINPVVTDNVSAPENIDVTISVTLDGETVNLTGNTFVASAGVYTVTVNAADEAGNEAVPAVRQITVTAAPDGDGGGKPAKNKLTTGAIVGIAVGSAVAAAAIGVGIYFLIKKLKKRREEEIS